MTEVERAVRVIREHLATRMTRWDGDNNDHPPERDFGWFLYRDDVLKVLDDCIAACEAKNTHCGVRLIEDDIVEGADVRTALRAGTVTD